MAKLKIIHLGRTHQDRASQQARRELACRPGGIILADGVGLGKTYEALATVAMSLAQRQHGRMRKRAKAYRVLVLVPPGLVTKWLDELVLPDRFKKYLVGWTTPATRAVQRTFEDVVVLRRRSDLRGQRGEVRYHRHILPPGLYLVNANLIRKEGRKITQLHKTPWDAIIADEAHRVAPGLVRLARNLFRSPHTKTLLLTATPFQLSPQEMKGTLEATFGGYGSPKQWWRAGEQAEELYNCDEFRNYRRNVSEYFRSRDAGAASEARRMKRLVESILRPRVIRNKKQDRRAYFLVNGEGAATWIRRDLFQTGDQELAVALAQDGLIDLDPETTSIYLKARDAIAGLTDDGKRTFVATALRQLLSTYGQFRRSLSGRMTALRSFPPDNAHPKVRALTGLVRRVLSQESKRAKSQGWMGKVLIFTTFVGADPAEQVPSGEPESLYGSAALLKSILRREVATYFPRGTGKSRDAVRAALLPVVDEFPNLLESRERRVLRRCLANQFAGSPAAALLLATPTSLRNEARTLRAKLKALNEDHNLAKEIGEDGQLEERELRVRERRNARFQAILDRYSTRDLVARYDGGTEPEARDRHLRGFNSPFAPFVLIASSVGQEGIDLQRYCSHVVHYDLEWNPARIEQREGRVDRYGREAKGPVNVYFLLCRGTYDERVLHVMVNRVRWHQILLARAKALEAPPAVAPDSPAPAKILNRLALDLRPR